MSRDFKHRTAPGRRRRAVLPAWSSFLVGLTAGLLVALGVHLHHSGRLDPWGEAARTWSRLDPRAPSPPAKPSEPAPERRPRFEFYTLLPEMEVVVPEREVERERTRPESARPEGTAENGGYRYVLQAGSFRQLEEADRLKAQLALIGLEARIQSVTVNGEETWHRVRIGPFRTLAELRTARDRLRENHLRAMVLKAKL